MGRICVLIVLLQGSAWAESWKNLQVLPKTLTKEEMKRLMKAQARALDVECDYCHQVPDMASEENPKKQIARQMIRMQNEINDKWFKAPATRVTCATCHRGKPIPQT